MLKEALSDTNINPGGRWKLLHLKGTELVADGCTKALLGQAFFRFIEDLGMKRPNFDGPSSTTESSSAGNTAALRAMLLGGVLLSAVEGKSEDEVDEDFTPIWVAGAVLMTLGAIYAGQLLHSASKFCIKRLCASEKGPKRRPRSRSEETATTEFSEEENISMVSDEVTTSVRRQSDGGAASSGPMVATSQRSSSGVAGSFMTSAEAASSMSITTPSGSRGDGDGTSSLSFRPQSGLRSAGGSTTSLNGSSRSGFNAAAAAGEPAASSSAAEALRVGGVGSSEVSKGGSKKPNLKNPWNVFQHVHRGKGLDSTSMARLYKEAKGPS